MPTACFPLGQWLIIIIWAFFAIMKKKLTFCIRLDTIRYDTHRVPKIVSIGSKLDELQKSAQHWSPAEMGPLPCMSICNLIRRLGSYLKSGIPSGIWDNIWNLGSHLGYRIQSEMCDLIWVLGFYLKWISSDI